MPKEGESLIFDIRRSSPRYVNKSTSLPQSVSSRLMEWRREWNMEDYLIQARAETGLTMANLFGGGGLCTLGGVRAGFNPIWSTEVVGFNGDGEKRRWRRNPPGCAGTTAKTRHSLLPHDMESDSGHMSR